MRKRNSANKIVISGNSNRPLAQKIARFFDYRLGKSETVYFADGEISAVINDDVKGKDVIIAQSLSFNPNNNLMELLMLADTAKRYDPASIKAFIPYLGYSRSDREVIKGESVGSALVPKLLRSAGIKQVITVDVHSKRVMELFKGQGLSLKNIESIDIFINYMKNKKSDNDIIISPDKGGMKRAEYASGKLGIPFVQFDKKRPKRNQVVFKKSKINLDGKNVLIFEDIIDTGGTIIKISEMLKDLGCKSIRIFATHGLFSNNALLKIDKSKIDNIIVTDTVLLEDISSRKVGIVSICKFLDKNIF